MSKIKTYSELMKLPTFDERLEYLRLKGVVGRETYGWERYFNQRFYKDPGVWKRIRRDIILRDGGCDLGIEDMPIPGRIIVHHMNPITIDDIEQRSDFLTSPEFLICVSHETHQAIHYGSDPPAVKINERRPFDTCPWKTEQHGDRNDS